MKFIRKYVRFKGVTVYTAMTALFTVQITYNTEVQGWVATITNRETAACIANYRKDPETGKPWGTLEALERFCRDQVNLLTPQPELQ